MSPEQIDVLAAAVVVANEKMWGGKKDSTPLAEVVEDLKQLDREFNGTLGCDADKHLMWIETVKIVLEDVDLGRFRITLRMNYKIGSQYSDQPAYTAFRGIALDPNPYPHNPAVTHPYITSEVICLGSGTNAVAAALKECRIAEPFLIIQGILVNYYSGHTYGHLEHWRHLPCDNCLSPCIPDKKMNMATVCTRCRRPTCSNCLQKCVTCHTLTCKDCVLIDGGKTYCYACGIPALCVECGVVPVHVRQSCSRCLRKLCSKCLTSICDSCKVKFCRHCGRIEDGKFKCFVCLSQASKGKAVNRTTMDSPLISGLLGEAPVPAPAIPVEAALPPAPEYTPAEPVRKRTRKKPVVDATPIL